MLLTSQAWITTAEGTFAIVYEADIALVARRLPPDNEGRVASYRTSGGHRHPGVAMRDLPVGHHPLELRMTCAVHGQ